MDILDSYVGGEWKRGSTEGEELVDPTTEEVLGRTSTDGLDWQGALEFARREGGPALRGMTFAERGELLRAMSRAIHGARDELIEAAIRNGGNTRGDAKFDIDGAAGTLAHYADLGAALGDARVLVDGDGIQLGRSPRFVGQHVFVPKTGVAVHINAFNFPAWGLGEKAACALLAGMPIVSKPAAPTALVAWKIAKLVAPLLPRGAFSFVAGPPGGLLAPLGVEDVVAFTGSSRTAAVLRSLPQVVSGALRLNVEADSLNAAVLGPDVAPGSDTWNLFLKDVVREMTQKAGQKCTAMRRIFVPKEVAKDVEDELVAHLREIKTGNPAVDGVTVGPLATAAQLRSGRAGVEKLATAARVVLGGAGPFEKVGVTGDKGFFLAPTLLVCDAPDADSPVHEHEVFGPVATLLAYDGTAAHAARLVAKGQGGLVCTVYSDDRGFTAEALFGIAPFHGRVMLASEKIADQAPGPGTVLPQMLHGGPGRAGGGEELGGPRGLALYSQRVAVQGSRPILEAILGLKKG